jgi:RimJ/RimL family protein N-acetyltransferase
MLKGQKILLRPVEIEDIPLLAEWKNNRDDTISLNSYKPVTELQEEARYSLEQEDNRSYSFIIEAREEEAGYCGLQNIDWISRRAEINILITSENRQKGYGKEAIQLLLTFAFNDLNLHRIYLTCIYDNKSALNLYKSTGFKDEGILRQHIYTDGRYEDMHLLGMLKEEWLKLL